MELLKPSPELEAEHRAFLREFADAGEPVFPWSAALQDMAYAEWLVYTKSLEAGATCPEGLVPADSYFLMENGRLLGAVNIRHYVNLFLLRNAGHIGYGVRPSERGRGIAAAMLQMALLLAKDIGLCRVLLVCDTANRASAKTIMRCGGVLENESVHPDGSPIQRYWITL